MATRDGRYRVLPTDDEIELSFEDIFRIEAARDALNALARDNPEQWRRYKDHIQILWGRSRRIEPDGAGLPCILQAARELLTTTF